MNTQELIANQPAAVRKIKGTVQNNCAAEPEHVSEAEELQSVIVKGTEVFPRVLTTPRIVYATAEEWQMFDDARHALAQFAEDLDTVARIDAESLIEDFETRGIILRARTSKARVSNLLAYDLCEGTANRTACEGAIVSRATKSSRFDHDDMALDYAHLQESVSKRAAAKRAAKLAAAQAYLAKLGLTAADLA